MYRVELASPAQRELNRIRESDRARIAAAVAGLRNNPRPTGSLKLTGPLHRLRVGAYRIIYAISDREELVVALEIGRREKDTHDQLPELF